VKIGPVDTAHNRNKINTEKEKIYATKYIARSAGLN